VAVRSLASTFAKYVMVPGLVFCKGLTIPAELAQAEANMMGDVLPSKEKSTTVAQIRD
jgi:hypothetical protein